MLLNVVAHLAENYKAFLRALVLMKKTEVKPSEQSVNSMVNKVRQTFMSSRYSSHASQHAGLDSQTDDIEPTHLLLSPSKGGSHSARATLIL